MVAWSAFRSGFLRLRCDRGTPLYNAVAQRFSSEKTMNFTPSRFQWNKFKDMLHYYLLVGAIPVAIIITCSNVFVGPATLEPIPEDYNPKHWEYYQHPITRFLAKYIQHTPQQDYETQMHWLWEENEKKLMRKLTMQIEEKMQMRQDYQSIYFRPAIGKYLRKYKEDADDLLWKAGEE